MISHQINSNGGMSYKITGQYSSRCQSHERQEKTKKLSKSIGDHVDIIMWNPGLDLEIENGKWKMSELQIRFVI